MSAIQIVDAPNSRNKSKTYAPSNGERALWLLEMTRWHRAITLEQTIKEPCGGKTLPQADQYTEDTRRCTALQLVTIPHLYS
jgi:hypothetical protein